jgi:hypothetical protein
MHERIFPTYRYREKKMQTEAMVGKCHNEERKKMERATLQGVPNTGWNKSLIS